MMATQIECPRCNGTGHINEYAMISDGVCFKCSGTGKVNAPVARKMSAKQIAKKAERDARIQAEADAYQRVMTIAISDPRVMTSPRMRVTKDHPYFYMHAMEVYQWHEKWGWNTSS